jgi:diaminohydroxyphosphoribosylaminopyrimidine deaminase / 5-amino-6-(5-phosphoribosylamino)uracil reductase
MPSDEEYLRQAIRLAMNGRGQAEPNPMVGCVIVKNDRIIGQGYHQKFGGPHAEPNALASCTESPQGATAYVTLEPCSYLDKKTPPCSPLLIQNKLARVVIGCLDPNPKVNGNGVKMLRDAGIQVETGLLESECKQLIAPFLAGQIYHRPYVIMKWAQTADKKIAGPNGQRLQISNRVSDRLVHRLRHRCDAIVVGVNTVIVDDPMLIARGNPDPRTPIRFILDHNLRTPENSNLVRTANKVPVIIAHGPNIPLEKKSHFESLGVKFCPISDLRAEMFALNITNALIEPGPTLAKSMFEENLVDLLWVITSPTRLDDPTAPAAAAIPPTFITTGRIHLQNDSLSEYLNPASQVFFTPTPSADLPI